MVGGEVEEEVEEDAEEVKMNSFGEDGVNPLETVGSDEDGVDQRINEEVEGVLEG